MAYCSLGWLWLAPEGTLSFHGSPWQWEDSPKVTQTGWSGSMPSLLTPLYLLPLIKFSQCCFYSIYYLYPAYLKKALEPAAPWFTCSERSMDYYIFCDLKIRITTSNLLLFNENFLPLNSHVLLCLAHSRHSITTGKINQCCQLGFISKSAEHRRVTAPGLGGRQNVIFGSWLWKRQGWDSWRMVSDGYFDLWWI